MATYEFWLTNDRGERIGLLNPSFFDYTRSAIGLGTFHFGMPTAEFRKLNPYPFTPDWMIDAFRCPGEGYPMRRENIYFLRKPNIYVRQDGMEMIEMWGRDAKDLLNRRYVIQPAETVYTRKSGAIDDVMKYIVMEQMQYGYAVDQDGVIDYNRAWPPGEFSVEHPFALGPAITDHDVSDGNVMEALKELRNLSFQKNREDPTQKKVYFDVLPGQNLDWGTIYILDEAAAFDPILDAAGDPLLDEISGTSGTKPMMLQFQTFAGLRGADRRNGVVFSVRNGNVKDPSYALDYLEAKNTAIVRGQGRGDNRITTLVQDEAAQLSRWNRVETVASASSETDEAVLDNVGQAELWKERAEELLDLSFIDNPGNEETPRSLYGIDWDLGDLLRVNFAGRNFDVEVTVVYVSVDDKGAENVVGRISIDE